MLVIIDILIANSSDVHAAIWGIIKWWTYVPEGSIFIPFLLKLPPFIVIIGFIAVPGIPGTAYYIYFSTYYINLCDYSFYNQLSYLLLPN